MISISRWHHKPLRTRAANGRLTEAGYEWNEGRIGTYLLVAAAGLIAGAMGLIGIVKSNEPAVIFLLPFAITCLVILVWASVRPRIVLFDADGWISTPNGVPRRLWVDKLRFRHSEIASIELTADCQNWGVVLFTTDGYTVLLAHCMYKADARLIAVQLTKALREMRESLATVASRQQASPAAHATEAWVH